LLLLRTLLLAKSKDRNAWFLEYYSFKLISAVQSSDVPPVVFEVSLSTLQVKLNCSLETDFFARSEHVLGNPKSSPRSVLSSARLRKEVNPTSDIPSLFTDETLLLQRRFGLEDCLEVLKFLHANYGEDAVLGWKDICRKYFPYALEFRE
jgi:hypothetical protein